MDAKADARLGASREPNSVCFDFMTMCIADSIRVRGNGHVSVYVCEASIGHLGHELMSNLYNVLASLRRTNHLSANGQQVPDCKMARSFPTAALTQSCLPIHLTQGHKWGKQSTA